MKFSVKMPFPTFWSPEKSVCIFKLMTNLNFSFPESGPGEQEVFTFPQNQYFHLSFQTFKGSLKILQITFCPQIQQEKSFKWS